MANPQRGDIFHFEIPQDQTVGSEEYGYRAWLVVSASKLSALLPIAIVVPLTTPLDKDRDGYDKFRIRIKDTEKITEPGEKGLVGESLALAEQVRVISTDRLPEKRSCRVKKVLYKIDAAVAFVLDMPVAPLTATPTTPGPIKPPLAAKKQA